MDTVYAPAGRTVEQRVESYYPRTGVDEGGSVRRHTAERIDGYCLRIGENDSGTTSRKLLSTHWRGRGW